MSLLEIFEPEPAQWGLRGDPSLWRDLKDHFKGLEESSDIIDADAFRNELIRAAQNLIGCELGTEERTYITRYDNRGMSRGLVSHQFWLERGIPMLEKRFLDATDG